MLDSIVDLMKARPHLHRTARFSPSELQAYHEGYYTGLVYALRVADQAIHRFKLYQAARREAAREKRSA